MSKLTKQQVIKMIVENIVVDKNNTFACAYECLHMYHGGHCKLVGHEKLEHNVVFDCVRTESCLVLKPIKNYSDNEPTTNEA